MPSIPSPDQWLSRPAASRLAGLTLAALDRAIAEGKIPIRRPPGGHPRVNLADVARFAESITSGAAAGAVAS
jgi:hypothetical protein